MLLLIVIIFETGLAKTVSLVFVECSLSRESGH